jgi:hypothetical protein
MNYPTFEEIITADRKQICAWWRFLPSPGTSAIGVDNFQETLNHEVAIMEQIGIRLNNLGGFTPEISKSLTSEN